MRNNRRQRTKNPRTELLRQILSLRYPDRPTRNRDWLTGHFCLSFISLLHVLQTLTFGLNPVTTDEHGGLIIDCHSLVVTLLQPIGPKQIKRSTQTFPFNRGTGE